MTKFELFCLVYAVLDAAWDETKEPHLGEYLSGANPFLFEGIGSANPEVFHRFSENVDDPITIENSYCKAKEYISTLDDLVISNAFLFVDEEEWKEGVKGYLSCAHKGGENDGAK